MAKSGMTVIGIEEIEDVLTRIAPKHARNLMRSTIHGVAAEITKDAKKNAPKNSGNLKKSLKTKRRKSPPNKPVSEVVATQGKGVKNDGFYWRFVEYGVKGGASGPQSPQPFIQPAKDKVMAQLPNILKQQFVKKLTAAVKREQKKSQRAKK